MNHITEQLSAELLLAPQAIAQDGYATSGFADMSGRFRYCFATQLGPVAAGKTVTVTLLSSPNASGSDATEEEKATFTAPEGGASSHVMQMVGRVSPLRGRYLGIQVTNGDGAAALNASVLLLAEGAYRPEGSKNSMTEVT